METQANIDEMTRAYLECALWTGTDEDDSPLDEGYSIDGFAPIAVAEAAKVCAKFAEANADDLSDIENAHAGHDLWLTRNRHGTGFWDRGHPEDIGKRLTDAAHALGEAYAYVGDDGHVWIG